MSGLKAFFDQRCWRWKIINFTGVEEGEQAPEEQLISLSEQEVMVLLEAVAETELINKVLAKRAYDKDMANRHLDIIDALIRNAKPQEKQGV
jgi:hypothetical protein